MHFIFIKRVIINEDKKVLSDCRVVGRQTKKKREEKIPEGLGLGVWWLGGLRGALIICTVTFLQLRSSKHGPSYPTSIKILRIYECPFLSCP